MVRVKPAGASGTSGLTGSERTFLVVLLSIAGVFALLAGLFAVGGTIMNRLERPEPSRAGPVRAWRDVPVATIFPARLDAAFWAEPDTGWVRTGVDPRYGCTGPALSRPFRARAEKAGCQAVLRATYVDPTRWTVGTAAIVLTRDLAGAGDLDDWLGRDTDRRDLVGAYRVPGTLAARFTDARRIGVAHSAPLTDAPYVIAVTTGATDGRVAGRLPRPWGREKKDQKLDRESWGKDAEDLVDRVQRHLADILDGPP